MQFTIEVNNKSIKAEKGETILSALNRNGIMIPTLCRMQEFTPTGACRMCVVEVAGRDRLVTACSAPVEEWMKDTDTLTPGHQGKKNDSGASSFEPSGRLSLL